MRSFNPPNLSNAREIVYDTETDGLDWKKNKVVGYVLTWGPRPDETTYFPVRHAGGGPENGNYDPQQVESWLRTLAARPDILWTGHHMKFDLHMSENHGIKFAGRVNCTQVNAALIDETQGRYSLDFCAKKYGVTEKKGDKLYARLATLFGGPPERKQMEHFHKLRGDDILAVDYAAGDGTSTWEVWQKQKELLAHDNLGRVHDLECRVIRTLQRMERRGVPIDEERYQEVRALVAQMIDKAAAQFPKDFNARSNKQMRDFMESKGHTDWPLTPKGAPSFKEEWLETFPLGKDIIRLRKYRNLMSTFLDGQIDAHIHNGRVHTTFNQLKMDDYGTVTGRLSSSDPNLQQVTKRDKEIAPIYRSIFHAGPGHMWSANDYMQQEYVVFAHYANSAALIAGYAAEPPVDMHGMVAQMMSVERDPTAKRLNLGKLYGMGVAKLARSLKISESEAKKLSQLWDDTVPEAKGFLKTAEAVAKKRYIPNAGIDGWVCTLLGRRRRLSWDIHHKAGNAIIQMCSADITKLKMVEIDEHFEKHGDTHQLILQVHDELDWLVPDGADPVIQEEALRIMQDFSEGQPIHLRARLRVDSSMGRNWGEATFA